MDTNYIKYIQKIATCGSIHKASKELFISQPHLTAIISKIEYEFGITLFDRTSKGAILTDEGRDFLIHTTPILTKSEDLKTTFHSSTKKNTKYFSLSCSRFQLLLDAFLELEEFYEDKNIHFSYKETCIPEIIDDVKNNKSNLGIFSLPSLRQKLFIKKLKNKNIKFEYIDIPGELCIIVHKNNPLSAKKGITINELKDYTYVSYGDEVMYDLNYFTEYEMICFSKVSKSIKVYDRYSMWHILSKRNYYSIGFDTKRKNKDFVCIPIKDISFNIVCILIYNELESLSEQSKKYIEIIKSY